MTDYNITDLGSLDIAQGGNWEPIPAGTYTFEVDSAEWANSKAGNLMIVITFVGLDEEIAGQQYIMRNVLAFTNKKTGKTQIHWNIPSIALAAGGEKLFPADPAKRSAIMRNTEDWCNKVAKGLVGKKATLTLTVVDGSPYIDSNGEEQEGSPQNELKKFEFATVAKTSASKITI